MSSNYHKLVQISGSAVARCYDEMFGPGLSDREYFGELLADWNGWISFAILDDMDRRGLVSAGEYDAIDEALTKAHDRRS